MSIEEPDQHAQRKEEERQPERAPAVAAAQPQASDREQRAPHQSRRKDSKDNGGQDFVARAFTTLLLPHGPVPWMDDIKVNGTTTIGGRLDMYLNVRV